MRHFAIPIVIVGIWLTITLTVLVWGNTQPEGEHSPEKAAHAEKAHVPTGFTACGAILPLKEER